MSSAADRLRKIKRFDQLLAYLRDELDWPVDEFEFDELTYDWEPEELGIETKLAAKIQEIKQMRPLATDQQWGIFFVKFEPKRLPMVAMRRLLNRLVMKKRASTQNSDQASWRMHDLLFISQYGEGEERKISFAQFAKSHAGNLADLKVLTWGETQTDLTLEDLDNRLHDKLTWPEDPADAATWRAKWSSAFTRRHGHVIRTSKELAAELATLARAIYTEAVKILEIENENGPLTKLYKAFQQALIHDLEEKDFADMYAQTITYGLFSTAVSGTDTAFGQGTFVNTERMVQLVPNTNPFLREMLSTFLTAGGENGGLNFDELGINEVVELLNDEKTDLPAIIREFGAKKKDEDPVIHFYEEFLKAYNAKLRFQRGVFYTPQPVVSYIVRSVHELLQTEFGLEDGLADTTTWGEMVEHFKEQNLEIPDGMSANDPFVQILDPATGTATFLVEVIDVIHKTMTAKWKQAGKNEAQCRDAWNEYVPQHLLPRVYGYELMMAPYAIAHMKIGLKLTETGYRFGSEERARVFLTNALEPTQRDIQQTLGDWFPALAHESEAVNAVKSKQKFTVVVGNPPYSVMSGNLSEDARKIVDPFRYVDGVKIKERSMLRLEMHLQDDYVKFLALTASTLREAHFGLFGMITNNGYLDNLTLRGVRCSLTNGFSQLCVLNLHGNRLRQARDSDVTDENVFDIEQGVAIAIGVHGFERVGRQVYSEAIGLRAEKNALLSTLEFDEYDTIAPKSESYFLVPHDDSLESEYRPFVSLTDLMPANISGIVTAHDKLVVDFGEKRLRENVSVLLNDDLEDAAAQDQLKVKSNAGWKFPKARREFSQTVDLKRQLLPYGYRPFDTRVILYNSALVWCDRKNVMKHVLSIEDNFALATCRQLAREPWEHAFATRFLQDDCLISNRTRERSYHFPLYVDGDLLDQGKVVNVAPKYIDWFSRTIGHNMIPESIVTFAYAILFSPTYRTRYEELLCIDFPRIPIPNSQSLFKEIVARGSELLQLHLGDTVETFGTEVISNGDMIVEKAIFDSASETVWLDKAKSCGFQGIGNSEWEFHIGCYQVLHKWLKDRQAKGGKNPRPGRKLTKEDIEHYQKMVVAIRETIRLMGEIDEVIDQHGGWPDAFVTEPIELDSTDKEPKLPFA